jgi:hypothetical protein
MKAFYKALFLLTMLTSAVPSQAAVVLYTNEATYLSAVGATLTYIDFAGSPNATVSGASFSPNVTFGSCTDSSNPGTCGTQVLHASDAITDLGGSSAANGVASLAFRLNIANVFAFAFNYESGAIDAMNLVDTALNLSLVDTTAATGFIGLVSDTAFYGAIAVNGLLPEGNDRYFISDFRINEPRSTSVPEPGVLALGAIALMGAVIVMRRRSAVRRTIASAG